jgi:hypothetical protein
MYHLNQIELLIRPQPVVFQSLDLEFVLVDCILQCLVERLELPFALLMQNHQHLRLLAAIIEHQSLSLSVEVAASDLYLASLSHDEVSRIYLSSFKFQVGRVDLDAPWLNIKYYFLPPIC